MSSNTDYDLVVIGGGPAGYAGAIRAGQLGKRVACVEMERPGGTCLNWGCIPSKALLKSAEIMEYAKKAADFGIRINTPEVDFAQVIKRSRSVADQMAKGIEFLFKKNKVDYIRGKGTVSAPGMVEVIEGADAGRYLKTQSILLATGCRPRRLPGLAVDGERIFTSREALVMKGLPKSIAIIGAGAIGVEFAYFLNALGSQVHLIEMLPRLLPVEDAEVSQTLARSFKKQKINCYTNTKVENIAVNDKGVHLNLVEGKQTKLLEVEVMLLSIGVSPLNDGLIGKSLRIDDHRGYFKVNDRYETSIPGIFAAGDIIGPPWLAHVATFEAIQAVNGIFGISKPRRVKNFPGCTYCHPQVASIGLTEEKAREAGHDFAVGKFPLTANGKSVAAGASDGFIKIISDKKYGEILGAHIIGGDATELIAEFGLAMEAELTIEDLHHTIHAHPTMSEASMEAAALIAGEAIHL